MVHPRDARRLAKEVAIVAAFFVYYVGGNLLFEGDRATAVQNAQDLVALQGMVGLNVEAAVQDFFEARPALMVALVLFYAGPHFLLTVGFLAWVFVRRPDAYAHVRNAFLLFTITAFTFQWFFPVAPPRYVPGLGFTDTVTNTLPVNGETEWVGFLVNEVAALPSVHTGWALLVSLFVVRLTTHPARWTWLVYPALIMVSIVATANHFVWDIVAALAWLGMTELAHTGLQHKLSLPRLSVPVPTAAVAEDGA